jgi:RNA polymerase sigma-70 factor (sigma-E family)
VNRADEYDYREFVVARLDAWRRTAYLLCRDWHLADDLVAITIGKLYRHWVRVRDAERPDAYVRGVLANVWLDERRRPWRRESPAVLAGGSADEPSYQEPAYWAVGERSALSDLLDSLPARQRAVLVLRFYCDLSVEETAATLNMAEGTVKSQSARGLETLRSLAVGGYDRQE